MEKEWLDLSVWAKFWVLCTVSIEKGIKKCVLRFVSYWESLPSSSTGMIYIDNSTILIAA